LVTPLSIAYGAVKYLEFALKHLLHRNTLKPLTYNPCEVNPNVA
jgi:hypothetical protein